MRGTLALQEAWWSKGANKRQVRRANGQKRQRGAELGGGGGSWAGAAMWLDYADAGLSRGIWEEDRTGASLRCAALWRPQATASQLTRA
ncbi:hypothetical protein PSPO01_14380 [Paraphaeosphaeria sporulosa]